MAARRKGIARGALALLFVFLAFAVRPYRVSGGSMEPTLREGQFVFVENVSPRLLSVPRGALVAFRDPRHPQHPVLVKRVVGLPNETVRVSDDAVTVVAPDGTEQEFRGGDIGREKNGDAQETKLGPEDYYLLGDNRPQSTDSRSWGTIQPREMIGRVLLRVPDFEQ